LNITNKELAYSKQEKEKRADGYDLNLELTYQRMKKNKIGRMN
jgi:hypothetical protein